MGVHRQHPTAREGMRTFCLQPLKTAAVRLMRSQRRRQDTSAAFMTRKKNLRNAGPIPSVPPADQEPQPFF